MNMPSRRDAAEHTLLRLAIFGTLLFFSLRARKQVATPAQRVETRKPLERGEKVELDVGHSQSRLRAV